jgi:hypothetical protein
MTNVSTHGDCTVEFSFAVSLTRITGRFITATATDPDGHKSEFSNYLEFASPQDSTQQLIDQVKTLVEEGVLNRGQGSALIAKLEAAINQMKRGNFNGLPINCVLSSSRYRRLRRRVHWRRHMPGC